MFCFELQTDLEPNGRMHVKIELQWATQEEQSQPMRQFKEQEGFAFKPRRGAMKRRVHQVTNSGVRNLGGGHFDSLENLLLIAIFLN